LLVALVTLTAFLPALQNQFVNWDDDKNFLDNPHYRGLTGTHLRWMWTTFHIGHYAPLTWMTLGLDYLLWGMNSLGYLIAQGKLAEAIEHYQQAVRIRPDYAEAHNNWGVVLTQQGKLAEAIEHFQQALRIQPENAEAHNNWGVVLDRQGKPAEAIEHFQQALRIKLDYAEARANLARALALQGKGR